MVANRMVTPIAIIGPRVDLAVKNPIELARYRDLLRNSASVEANDAEKDRPRNAGPRQRATAAKRPAWRAHRLAAFL
jgi:hypothetical protein